VRHAQHLRGGGGRIGDKVRTRDGQIGEITAVDPYSGRVPVAISFGNWGATWYWADGTYGGVDPGTQHPLNIVEFPYPKEQETPAARPALFDEWE